MLALLRFSILAALKVLSRVFYRFTVEWVHGSPESFKDARIGILLNHTSLFEPVYMGILPLGWLWQVSHRGLLPGADVTLNRPIAGRFIRWMVADTVSVTRSRDRTWTEFLSRIKPATIVVMAPEGRMRRPDGLDKHGRPMSVRGGIVDVLERYDGGNMVVLYSGGLHHVQKPGGGRPRLFKRVHARFECLPIRRYKREMGHGTPEFRANVMKDLDSRRDRWMVWDGSTGLSPST